MGEQQKAKELAITKLIPFEGHIFKPYRGKKFEALVNSISENGVIVPIIVRQKNDKYEILSGHNRVTAAKAAGLETVPAIIREGLSEDEAKLIVTVTNLIQRSFADLSHSERAAALTEHYNAIKSQGKRTDLISSIAVMLGENETSVTPYQKLNARDYIAKSYGIGGSTVAQYIRAARIIEPLKERLDNGEFSLRSAVELSYLSEDTQAAVDSILSNEDGMFSIDVKTASELRAAATEGVLETDETRRIIAGMKRTPRATKAVKIDSGLFTQYFAEGQSENDIAETVEKALEAWFAKSET